MGIEPRQSSTAVPHGVMLYPIARRRPGRIKANLETDSRGPAIAGDSRVGRRRVAPIADRWEIAAHEVTFITVGRVPEISAETAVPVETASVTNAFLAAGRAVARARSAEVDEVDLTAAAHERAVHVALQVWALGAVVSEEAGGGGKDALIRRKK